MKSPAIEPGFFHLLIVRTREKTGLIVLHHQTERTSARDRETGLHELDLSDGATEPIRPKPDSRMLIEVAREGRAVELDHSAYSKMEKSCAWVDLAASGNLRDSHNKPQAVYGINTGFGSLARLRIPQESLNQLQRNLIRSHAAGVGSPAPRDVARATVLLRANALAKGASGCRPLLVERLLALLNKGCDPILPSQGSCGSSGDLAPLAHLGLS